MTPPAKKDRVGVNPDWLLESTSKRRGWRRDMTPTVRDSAKWDSGYRERSL
jgi:hypothetical protein